MRNVDYEGVIEGGVGFEMVASGTDDWLDAGFQGAGEEEGDFGLGEGVGDCYWELFVAKLKSQKCFLVTILYHIDLDEFQFERFTYFIFSPVLESVYSSFEGVMRRFDASPVDANTFVMQANKSGSAADADVETSCAFVTEIRSVAK
jgi:hypothetical protein